MALETSIVLDGLQFTEGPRWHEGELWFSDMGAGCVMKVDPAGNAGHIVDVPGYPSGLGWDSNGALLVVSMEDYRLMRFEESNLTEHDLSRTIPDGICLDAGGAVWVASPWGDIGIHRVLEGGEITDQVKVETQSFAIKL